MRRVMKIVLAVAVVAGSSAPRQARAEAFLNPWAGVVFGNDHAEKKFGSFGVALGDAGHVVGYEVNFGFAPDFFEESVDNNVIDMMANILVGPMAGDQGSGVRPYVAGGLGLIRTSIDGLGSSKDFSFNVGGGIFAYFSSRLGIRGDVRYLRTFDADNDLGLGEFDFWRASIGLTIH